MRTDPRLADARRDGGFVQARDAATHALSSWRSDPAVVPMLRALDAYGSGEPLAECEALAALFEGRHPRGPVARLIASSLAVMRDQPLSQLNFRESATVSSTA